MTLTSTTSQEVLWENEPIDGEKKLELRANGWSVNGHWRPHRKIRSLEHVQTRRGLGDSVIEEFMLHSDRFRFITFRGESWWEVLT